MIELRDLFHIITNKRIVANQIENGPFNFVSTQTNNLGICKKIKKLSDDYKLHHLGAITVSIEGSILNAFVQPDMFYANDVVRVLLSKEPMSIREKYYYCLVISKNRYKHNYGRKAYTTLASMLIPNITNIPDWVYTIKLPDYSKIKKPYTEGEMILDTSNWKYFELGKLFYIYCGRTRYGLKNVANGNPLISATTKNNGISKIVEIIPKNNNNTITIANNGKPGVSFYQPINYNATPDITILQPLNILNPYIGLFLIIIIQKEQYRFNYGRKFPTYAIKKHKIKLPVDANGNPDWNFMESYIKILQFSSGIINKNR